MRSHKLFVHSAVPPPARRFIQLAGKARLKELTEEGNEEKAQRYSQLAQVVDRAPGLAYPLPSPRVGTSNPVAGRKDDPDLGASFRSLASGIPFCHFFYSQAFLRAVGFASTSRS